MQKAQDAVKKMLVDPKIIVANALLKQQKEKFQNQAIVKSTAQN